MPPRTAHDRAFQALLDLLFRREPSSSYRDSTLDHFAESAVIAGLGQTKSFRDDSDLLMLLASASMAPVDAIAYDTSSARPRWRVIAEHLSARGSGSLEELEVPSRVMASILDAWDSERGAVSDHARERALRATGYRCAICRVPFLGAPESLRSADPYKPYFEAPEELLNPEVDHIVAVSGTGTHRNANMQILCRACNLAKGAGLELSARRELQFCAAPIESVPRIHRFRLLQWCITHGPGLCASCGTGAKELTVRLRYFGAAYMRSNLEVRCYDCVVS